MAILQSSNPSILQFRTDVLAGLSRTPKSLPCKYFYDERGSRLFEEICRLDEYYLTRTELAVMRAHAGEMAERLGRRCLLVEFGAGSGLKTRILLDSLQEPAGYVPVDVAGRTLERTAVELRQRYPGLIVAPVCGDFTRPLVLPSVPPPRGRTAVYFPGSTIGNFGPAEAVALMRQIATLVGEGGGLLIGVDLKKDRTVLEPAYNDSRGVTAEFNHNLLARINRELGAGFQLDRFEHLAFFNETESRIEMHLVSRCAQTVRVGDVEFRFARGERVHTENSYKYGLDQFRELATAAGLSVETVWCDANRLFSVQYLEARN